MFDYQTVKLLHHHGQDDWVPKSSTVPLRTIRSRHGCAARACTDALPARKRS